MNIRDLQVNLYIKDIDEEFGKIFVDYEGTSQDDEIIVISKKNIYRIKKEPPR